VKASPDCGFVFGFGGMDGAPIVWVLYFLLLIRLKIFINFVFV
jgi:hypothetical protein